MLTKVIPTGQLIRLSIKYVPKVIPTRRLIKLSIKYLHPRLASQVTVIRQSPQCPPRSSDYSIGFSLTVSPKVATAGRLITCPLRMSPHCFQTVFLSSCSPPPTLPPLFCFNSCKMEMCPKWLKRKQDVLCDHPWPHPPPPPPRLTPQVVQEIWKKVVPCVFYTSCI